MSSRTMAKAMPRSRNTSIVTCHSPSHLSATSSSRSGWVALYRWICAPCTWGESMRVLIARTAYTGASTDPATSPVTYTTGRRLRRMRVLSMVMESTDTYRASGRGPKAVATGKPLRDGHALARLLRHRTRHRHAVERAHQRARDLLHARPVLRGAHAVHPEPSLRPGRVDAPVHVHYTGRRLHDPLHLLRRRHAQRVGRGVDLGDERREHRWSGGNLGHLGARAIHPGNRIHRRTHRHRDVVALP